MLAVEARGLLLVVVLLLLRRRRSAGSFIPLEVAIPHLHGQEEEGTVDGVINLSKVQKGCRSSDL